MSADVVQFPRRPDAAATPPGEEALQPLPRDLSREELSLLGSASASGHLGPEELSLLGPWVYMRLLSAELHRVRCALLERPALLAQLPAEFEQDLVKVYDEADALATLIAERSDD